MATSWRVIGVGTKRQFRVWPESLPGELVILPRNVKPAGQNLTWWVAAFRGAQIAGRSHQLRVRLLALTSVRSPENWHRVYYPIPCTSMTFPAGKFGTNFAAIRNVDVTASGNSVFDQLLSPFRQTAL